MSCSTFLEECASRLLKKYGTEELHRLQLLFPNRRASLFFMKALSVESKHPIWAPSASSMDDFLFDRMEYTRIDRLALLLVLYEAHRVYADSEGSEAQPFEHFSFWGEVILDDFEEIDTYLLSPRKVFTHLSALKEIDAKFDFLPEAHRALAERFWSSFLSDKTQRKEVFLELWRQLPSLYEYVQDRLMSERQAYFGQLLRLLAESPERYPQLTQRRLIFVGFNQLSAAEQRLMSYFIQYHQAEIYWDLDDFYMSRPMHEAAHFFHIYQKHSVLGPTLPNPFPRYFSEHKEIRTQVCAHPISEVQVAVRYLSDYLKAHPEVAMERVAIILPDEDLLLPLLHALPKKSINISMGYRLSSTPLKDFLRLFLSIWSKREALPASEWTQLLSHPYVQPFCGAHLSEEDEGAPLILHQYAPAVLRAPLFLRRALFESEELLEALEITADAWVKYGNMEQESQLQLSFDKEATGHRSPLSRLEMTYLNSFQEMLAHLRSSGVSELIDGMRIRAQRRLLENLLYQQRVPFIGEPLEGIQLMGILETRNLDFDCVIILDLNEGRWPPPFRMSTLLPQQLRRAYELPTYREEQASYAYVFYRLLHRARHLLLLHLSSEETRSASRRSNVVATSISSNTRTRITIYRSKQLLILHYDL